MRKQLNDKRIIIELEMIREIRQIGNVNELKKPKTSVEARNF